MLASASEQVGIEMPEHVAPQPFDRAFDFDAGSMESNPMCKTEEEGESSGGAVGSPATINPVMEAEEQEKDILTDEATGKKYVVNRVTGESEWYTVPIGEGGAAMRIGMPKNSHWSKLRTSVLATSVFKAGGKKRVKRLSQVVKARHNSATRETVDEIALPPHWEMVYDDAEGSYYYYNSETEETSWERPKE